MTPSTSRDVFPLRFKNRATRDALKHLAEATGTSMTEIAERAIEHEIALQGFDVERRLTEALVRVRSYRLERDADAWIAAAAEGEREGLDPFRDVRAATGAPLAPAVEPGRVRDPLGVLGAFRR